MGVIETAFKRSTLLFLLCPLLLAAEEIDLPRLPDPALALASAELNVEEAAACRELFKKLASDDFDTRETALNKLVAHGLSVLPLAKEFENNADPEIASQAKGLRRRIIFNFDGYLPTSPEIKAALKKKIALAPLKNRKISEGLAELAKTAGLPLLLDNDVEGLVPPNKFLQVLQAVNEEQTTIGDLLGHCCAEFYLGHVSRGDVYLVTTPEKAQRLKIQRHAFDWSGLGFNRDEAERVADALRPFLPADAELHTGSEVLVVRGEEECIARAARLLALLKPDAPDALWPVAQASCLPVDRRDACPTDALRSELEAPVTLILNAEDPLNALAQFKKQKHAVFAAANSDDEKGVDEAPFPPELQGTAPLRLTLRDVPLGLALRWLERRSRLTMENMEVKLGYEIGPGQRLQLCAQPKTGPAPGGCLCGADVSFLYGMEAGGMPALHDTAARDKLWRVLEPHLALYPSLSPERDVAVVRGRLFLQGNAATLLQALALVRRWRVEGRPPPPPAWRTALENALTKEIDWNGRDDEDRVLSGARVLPTLRKLGQINILLEDAADGSASGFQIKAEDAPLLPPGKYPLKSLLDDLARKAGAEWASEAGVIVLRPKAQAK